MQDILKIGTFNLYNLSLPDIQFYEDKSPYSNEEYNEKINWINNQLKTMNCDIVGFQEIFHEKAFTDVIKKSEIYKNAYYCVQERADENRFFPSVGLVSKNPIESYCYIENFPKEVLERINNFFGNFDSSNFKITKFSRPILKAIIKINEVEYTFFVVHLKSKRALLENQNHFFDGRDFAMGQAKSNIVRTLEAVAFRYILCDEMENNCKPVVVMGDFNDEIHSVTNEIVLGVEIDRNDSYKNKVKKWDQLLYNPFFITLRKGDINHNYSHIYNDYHSLLDYVLLSQEFLDANKRSVGFIKYAKVLNDHLINDDSPKKTKSDHGQVVVGIELKTL
ncbi:MAG: hypothetical protein A2086_11940 [Spirochaetes bacterium GWD1_27_9]|nr:MAG: hypothetical protein A2Z98_06820 [Spirochaetes bacterium GWB1_27_13]OHD22102.1 MAG: hypothetical protein A2Y34_13410 [Spirochaetes bacterium GWC1_27_15]OHD28947.1 MAG: hypothetical protein A2086_11940 [Spirochaetes bacterium GWD1_27_9]